MLHEYRHGLQDNPLAEAGKMQGGLVCWDFGKRGVHVIGTVVFTASA
jgi:hypothetical protein